MLLSLPRLIRWPGRRPAVLLLALTYAWAFVALDITHTHAAVLAPSAQSPIRASSLAPKGQQLLTRTAAGAPEAPCPVCAAVHAAAAALVQPPAPIRALVSARLLVVRPLSLTPTNSPSTLHLRGPPQA